MGEGRPRYKYLHLETHGFWTPATVTSLQEIAERPRLAASFDAKAMIPSAEFRTGLAFDRANESTDGILTGEEAESLNLRTVDLVVLSACESGTGDTVPNEGSLSLQRAFQSAGANTLVASLWPVPVVETRTLMAEFYRDLWALGPNRKLEALRNAQLKLRQGTGSEPLPPLYWAGWVMSGDPGDILVLEDPVMPVARKRISDDEVGKGNRFWEAVIWLSGGVLGVTFALGAFRIRRRKNAKERADTAPGPRPSYGSSDSVMRR